MGDDARSVPGARRLPPRSHVAYDALRRAVVEAEMAAGDFINESEWAARLDMSRTPVREALNRLRQEGLVETVPHRGTYVREASLEDLRDIFQLRKVLECLAVEEAVLTLSEAEIEEAEKGWACLARELESGITPGLEIVGRMDNAFHMMIVDRSSNRRLREFMLGLNQEVLRYQLLTARVLGDMRSTVEQHLRLARLLRERDAARMVVALKEHIADAEAVIFSAR